METYCNKKQTLRHGGTLLLVLSVHSTGSNTKLTLILLTWKIWWAPNNASHWQMEFNSAFKGLSINIIWRWQVRASSYSSNKLTNQMQQFFKFINWRFVSLNMFRVVNAVVSSWWWAWKRPKHVERHKTSSNKLVKLLHPVITGQTTTN